MAERAPIERLNEHVAVFRDDDRDGHRLLLTRANDGDFWISMTPDGRDMAMIEEQELFRMQTIRVRMPMIGGGDHPALYKALVALWRDVEKAPVANVRSPLPNAPQR